MIQKTAARVGTGVQQGRYATGGEGALCIAPPDSKCAILEPTRLTVPTRWKIRIIAEVAVTSALYLTLNQYATTVNVLSGGV